MRKHGLERVQREWRVVDSNPASGVQAYQIIRVQVEQPPLVDVETLC
jgi:hypothetical protein